VQVRGQISRLQNTQGSRQTLPTKRNLRHLLHLPDTADRLEH
jgi:hypothetical protein